MKFTQKDRKELHALIQNRWASLYDKITHQVDVGEEVEEEDTKYMDYLQTLHKKVDFIEDYENK